MTNAKYSLGSFQVSLLLCRTNGESVITINEKVKTSTALIVTSQDQRLPFTLMPVYDEADRNHAFLSA